jgi:hypothetical protein
MKYTECIHERTVWRAVRSGRWEESLQSHVSSCSLCQEVVRVSKWMQMANNTWGIDSTLPNASRIWCRAQWTAKRAAAETAIKPIVVFQKIACAVVALTAIGVSSWKWSQIQGWLGSFKQIRLGDWSPASFTPVSLGLFSMALGLLCIILFVILYTFLAERELDRV